MLVVCPPPRAPLVPYARRRDANPPLPDDLRKLVLPRGGVEVLFLGFIAVCHDPFLIVRARSFPYCSFFLFLSERVTYRE